MPVSTEHPAQAAWPNDRPDSALPPAPEAPFFDSTLNVWIITRYADITEALRHPMLAPTSLTSQVQPQALSDAEHSHIRDEVRDELSFARLNAWKEQLLHQAETCVARFPLNHPVDLLADYARPLCLSLAATVTGVDLPVASALCEKARLVSAAAADPYNLSLKAAAESAGLDLKPCFRPGPESLRHSGFVALSQTLPALLGNIWFTLIRHSSEWQQVHQNPDLLPQAIEELIRYTGFTRVLTRCATADLNIGDVFISKGQRILLRLQPAHHDSQWFQCPDHLDITRRAGAHLSFGSGTRSCVGAGLLRMASAAITLPLVSTFSFAELAASPQWQGGAVFVSPQTLTVHLRR